jgi:hypothetical protein
MTREWSCHTRRQNEEVSHVRLIHDVVLSWVDLDRHTVDSDDRILDALEVVPPLNLRRIIASNRQMKCHAVDCCASINLNDEEVVLPNRLQVADVGSLSLEQSGVVRIANQFELLPRAFHLSSHDGRGGSSLRAP